MEGRGWTQTIILSLSRKQVAILQYYPSYCLASRRGFEPRQTGLEAVMLPLHHRDIVSKRTPESNGFL